MRSGNFLMGVARVQLWEEDIVLFARPRLCAIVPALLLSPESIRVVMRKAAVTSRDCRSQLAASPQTNFASFRLWRGMPPAIINPTSQLRNFGAKWHRWCERWSLVPSVDRIYHNKPSLYSLMTTLAYKSLGTLVVNQFSHVKSPKFHEVPHVPPFFLGSSPPFESPCWQRPLLLADLWVLVGFQRLWQLPHGVTPQGFRVVLQARLA